MDNVQKDFDVSLGQGVIDNIPVGSNRTVTVQGLDSSGLVLYQGVATNIIITAGETTDAGTITMVAFTGDSTAPTNPSVSINNGADSTSSTLVTLTLSATDDVGVTAYFASETISTLSAADSGWVSITSSTNYTGNETFALSSGDGTKTVYVWFRDEAGNISVNASDSIILESVVSSVPTEGLVAYYPFNGNANDESANGNNGTVSGAALTDDRNGNSNSAYSFDGINDFIEVTHSESLDIKSKISISLWTKMDDAGGSLSLNQYFISKGTGQLYTEDNTYNFYLGNGANDWLILTLCPEGGSGSDDSSNVYSPEIDLSNLSSSEWYHFVATWDGSVIQLYKNGIHIEESDTEFSGIINSMVANLNIGKLGNNTRYFDGSIDDIRIYNRALSESEIQSLYNEASSSSVTTAFNMVSVSGGLTFPTGLDDAGTATVTNAYQIGETEVTYELWYAVYTWATENGYTFANAGVQGKDGGGTNQHPVTTINLRDSMVWMNALTEYYNAQNGTSLVAVYTYGGSIIRDSRDSNANACDNVVAGATNGFRLLTSDEWELAARNINDANSDGDIQDAGEYYPGNYASGATADYNDSGATGLVAVYSANSGSTAAVKSKNANALSLYDMSGNVWEWVFDLTGSNRLGRGGSWVFSANYLRVGYVDGGSPPDSEFNQVGFRLARTP